MVSRRFSRAEYVAGLIVGLGGGIPLAIAGITTASIGGIVMSVILLVIAGSSLYWLITEDHLTRRKNDRRNPVGNAQHLTSSAQAQEQRDRWRAAGVLEIKDAELRQLQDQQQALRDGYIEFEKRFDYHNRRGSIADERLAAAAKSRSHECFAAWNELCIRIEEFHLEH